MGELQTTVDWVLRAGVTGVLLGVIFGIYKRWFVHHVELDAMREDRDRERDRAEKAEQKMIDTIPVLVRANEQISRAPAVAERAVVKTAEAVEKTASVIKAKAGERQG